MKNKQKLTVIVTSVFLMCCQIIFGTPVFGVTNPSLSISLSPLSTLELNPGNFGSVAQTINITTDNYTGYVANLTNPTNSTDLINTTDSSLTIPTITLPNGSSSITENDFTFGYGISLDGINYFPAPNSTSNNILIGSNNAAGTNSHTITFGAKTTTDTVPGLYQKTFVITAVVNNPQYSITYDTNTTDTVNNMPSNTSTTTSPDGTITLPNTIPTRTNYLFLGWDEDNTVTTDPAYNPGDTITLEPTESNEITLYAIWKLDTHDYYLYINDEGTVTNQSYLNTLDTSHTFTIPNFPSIDYAAGHRLSGFAEEDGGSVLYQSGDTITLTASNPTKTLYVIWEPIYMQDFSCSELSNTYDTALLTDIRDGEQYNLTLLSDGLCWMTDNLRLGTTAVGGSITLNSTTSNVPSIGFTLTNIQDSGNTSWTGNASESRVYIQSGINGGLYNWYTAVAGRTTTSSSSEASYSICPSGWRLPTGNKNGDFMTMLYKEGILNSASANGYKNSSTGLDQIMASPLNFPLSGNYGNNGLAGVNSSGGHWTSTGNSSTQAYNAVYTSSTAGAFYVSDWTRGRSIRCVKQN